MTSRSCTKSYSRKVNTVASPSIQFDKLFRENSNRPSAAKSAGIVGKWGITSFTSIRSTNLNGRREDIRGALGAKRLKLDYGNQNARQAAAKDPFSFDTDLADTKKESGPAVAKPKKFFKSRNAASTVNEPAADAAIHRQVPDSQYGRARAQKQQTVSTPTRKASCEALEPASDASSRTESKPPIVLRICKGTARLISAEVQDSPDVETKSCKTPPSSSNVCKREERIPEPETVVKTSVKSTRSLHHQPEVTTVSIPLENSDMRRTTRSRAKNIQLEVSSATNETPSVPPVNINSTHSSGLSLTLRKSVTDSNNTHISHYDIVKTDCPAPTTYVAQPPIEPLIRHDQPLPTTTQELIDILSSDAESIHNKNVRKPPEPMDTSEIKTTEVLQENPTESSLENIDVEPEVTPEPKPDSDSERDQEMSYESGPTSQDAEKKTVVAKILDQDWSSGSEDSESAAGNTGNEVVNEAESAASGTKKSPLPSREVSSKPVVTKKGSIFKSRSTGATNGNKRRALYKHKWCDSYKESNQADVSTSGTNAASTASRSTANADSEAVYEDELEEEFENNKLTRVVTYPEPDADVEDDFEAVTSVRCGKKVKGFYTVVKNVKKAHQIQESGEFQEFNDDVEYILDTLRENNPNATRCLSAIRLASKCMAPAFRMHVRAHGTVAKFFKALYDATKDQSLGLCTATVMFVLSQDRLAMDLDRDCLELMLSLLESDASHKDALDDCGLSRAELLKNKEKVRQLCADIQAQGHAKHLNLDNITVGQLAMETLLSLTSKRAGEWFKEELRELGGLEHIVKTIRECHRHISSCDIVRAGWTESLLDKLRKVDRCLRVLENVTHMNEENQVYLLKYDEGVLVNTLANLYTLCGQEIPIYPTIDPSDKSSTGAVVSQCLFAILKVLINLTHRFNRQSFGSQLVGSKVGVIDGSLFLILIVPEFLPEEKRFDVMMLALILLINLVEQCDANKELIMVSKAPGTPENIFERRQSCVDALIELFYKQERLARAEEQKTDAILDGNKDSEQTETVSTTTKSQEEFIEETVTKLLQKAGRHMEHTLIAAYVVLLLGNLIIDNRDYESVVRSRLPDNNFASMIAVLQKFFNFMNLTASNETSSCGIAATEKVIKFLKTSDDRMIEELNEMPASAGDDSIVMADLSLS